MFGDKQFACTSLILSGKNRKKWSLVPRETLVLVLIFFQILTIGPYSVVLINHNECMEARTVDHLSVRARRTYQYEVR